MQVIETLLAAESNANPAVIETLLAAGADRATARRSP